MTRQRRRRAGLPRQMPREPEMVRRVDVHRPRFRRDQRKIFDTDGWVPLVNVNGSPGPTAAWVVLHTWFYNQSGVANATPNIRLTDASGTVVLLDNQIFMLPANNEPRPRMWPDVVVAGRSYSVPMGRLVVAPDFILEISVNAIAEVDFRMEYLEYYGVAA